MEQQRTMCQPPVHSPKQPAVLFQLLTAYWHKADNRSSFPSKQECLKYPGTRNTSCDHVIIARKRALSQLLMRNVPDCIVMYHIQSFHSSSLKSCLSWRLTKAVIIYYYHLNWTAHSVPVLRKTKWFAKLYWCHYDIFHEQPHELFFGYHQLWSGDYFSQEQYSTWTMSTVDNHLLL